MIRLVRSEWTKLFTTRLWIGLLLGGCALVGGFAALFTGFAGGSDSGLPAVGTADYEQLALALGKPTANAARVALKRAVARLLEEMNRNA